MPTKKIVLLADSKEIRIADYRARIVSLKEKLGKLTILEHPCEIRSICNEIITIKSRIQTEASGLRTRGEPFS